MAHLFSLDNHHPLSFMAAAGMGAYDNVRIIHKFGYNSTVGTSYETLWQESTAHTYITVATVMKVSSDDANDTAAGTGVRTVSIQGLDANYDELDETITLDGLTEVNTINSFLRVYRIETITAGSGEENAGNVYIGTGTVTSGKPAVVHGIMTPGYNQSLMGLYTIPNGFLGYLALHEMSSAVSKQITARIMVREEGSVFKVKDILALTEGGVDHEFLAPLLLPSKSDIEMQAVAVAGPADLAGAFMVCLIQI